MISKNQVLAQLNKTVDYICIVELASSLGASVSEVRQRLKNLGDKVENNNRDKWRIAKQITSSSILSESERVERDALENTVKQAFYIAGQALKQLRDKRLYRETHKTFESYVKERFEFSKRNAYYLIDAHEVVNNLKSEQIVHFDIILPTKESQCRPLTKLPPEQQREVWRAAVKQAKGRVPSAKIIKEIINQSISRPTVKENPTNQELIYKPGTGIDYVVHLDEETYKMLQDYQARIGTATKKGAIRRLIENAISE